MNGKYGSRIDIVNCNFNSKLNKNSSFIDGKEWNLDSPKVSIKSCIFRTETNNVKYSYLIMFSTMISLFVIIVFLIQKVNKSNFGI